MHGEIRKAEVLELDHSEDGLASFNDCLYTVSDGLLTVWAAYEKDDGGEKSVVMCNFPLTSIKSFSIEGDQTAEVIEEDE